MAQTSVVINEVSVHPSDGNKEWVEFFNPSGVDLRSYWIDDDTDFTQDSGGSAKKRMDTVMKGADDTHDLFDLPSSMFNNDGDFVVLFDNTGQIVDQFQYTTDPGVDITFGRTPDGNGSMQLLSSATKGSTNSGPQPTVTPTPQPTAKPTAEPTATKVPTPTKTSPTSTVTNISSDPVFETAMIDTRLKNTNATNGAYPTSILGISTTSAKKNPASKQGKEILIKSAKTSPVASFFMIAGGLFVTACGILIYLKRRNIF